MEMLYVYDTVRLAFRELTEVTDLDRNNWGQPLNQYSVHENFLAVRGPCFGQIRPERHLRGNLAREWGRRNTAFLVTHESNEIRRRMDLKLRTSIFLVLQVKSNRKIC
jgi:hypothetical protein